jgi:uncharacterized protein
MQRAALFVMALGCMNLAVTAQEPTRRLPPVVRASGEATVNATPDLAEVSVGVTNQQRTAQGAAADNANRTTAVVNSLKALTGSGDEVKTQQYSVNPSYSYPKPGGSPVIDGYTASNTIQVTLHDLSSVGKVIDSAMQAGATNVNGVNFTLKNDEAVRRQALAAAAQKARANAEAIAKALGLRVVGVLEAQSGEAAAIQPLYAPAKSARAMSAPMPTPIESGSVEVEATVTVTLEVAP